MGKHLDSSGEAKNVLSLEHRKVICQLKLRCKEMMKDTVYLSCIASYGN